MHDEQQEIGSGSFPTTQWTLILEVMKVGDPAAALNALGSFCECYRPAIRNFFLRRGLSREQAEDFTQSFFTSRVFEKWETRESFLHNVERREASKFRSFLSHVLWRFLQDEWRKSDRNAAHVSLSDPEFPVEEICGNTFENFGREFDRVLALDIIQKAACRSKNSRHHLAHLQGEISQAQAAKELGMLENTFKQAHFRFRERLARDLWDEVSRMSGPNEVEVREEIRYLMSLFG
jgi:DNA-directed RNA polymerase specialized sigma24 family protein